MIWVLWNIHDEPGLPKMVEAADRILPERTHVFVDGKYPEFPGDDVSDGFCIDAGIHIRASVDECAKRTLGLREIDNRAKDGDWVLVLDADEQLTSLGLPSTSIGTISFTRISDGRSYDRARLYHWKPGFEFRHRHYDLYLGDEHVATLDRGTRRSSLCGSGIHHDVRNIERDRAKAIYYRRLQDAEAV